MQKKQSFTYSIANRIRELRKERDMSQEELGERLGLSRQQIYRLESGQFPISSDRIEDIAKVFQTSPLEVISPLFQNESSYSPEAIKLLSEFKEFLSYKSRLK